MKFKFRLLDDVLEEKKKELEEYKKSQNKNLEFLRRIEKGLKKKDNLTEDS